MVEDSVPRSDLLALLEGIAILPRQLLLDTPGVRATVPLLRGVWGAALHDLNPDAYHSVFAPPEGTTPSYLLRPSPPDPATAPALHWFLFGPALAHDEDLRRSWDVASGMGLGPQRRRFHVRRLVPLGPDGHPAASAQPWSLAQAAWPLSGPRATTPCRLSFPAPLRLLRKGRLIEQPTLADLVVAAGRRLQALLPAGQRQTWEALEGDLLALARSLPAGPWQGRRLDLHRWSSSQQAELDLHGVCGVLDLLQGPGELWPLLSAAAWVHLGKGTTVGLGELQVLAWPG